jgi:pyrroloquinoline quinone biosynthesis protein D
MTEIAREARPRLAKGCRLNEQAAGGPVLLMPERALRLNATGVRIVQLCDGSRTLEQILQTLAAEFPGAKQQQREADAATFLQRLHEKRAIDLS